MRAPPIARCQGPNRSTPTSGPASTRRCGAPPTASRVRDVDELVGVVAAVASLSERRARRAVDASLLALAELVPEEVADILAVLPAELEHLWLDVTTADD